MAPISQSEVIDFPSAKLYLPLDALLHHAGIAPLDDLGWLRVTGEDRVRWLNGMVTNSINDLQPGQGCYNFILSAQGRIQGTVNAFALPNSILLQTDQAQIDTLTATLDRFIIMDDVELTDTSSAWSGMVLAGPAAPQLLARLGIPAPVALSFATQLWRAQHLHIVAAHSPLVPRFELWADAAAIVSLQQALTSAGAISCDSEALEHLRILEGTPRYGTDIRDRELPQETTQTRALHFAKGCYLGQEIVERIRSRGAVHRTFSGFQLHGTLPPAGTALEANTKAIGELTSVAAITLKGTTHQYALGYVRREAVAQAEPVSLSYPGGRAVPVSLPFTIL